MKQKLKISFLLIIITAIFLNAAEAQTRGSAEISGFLDSTVFYSINNTDRFGIYSESTSWGLEEFANLRLRIRTGEKAILNASFNLAAITGDNEGSFFISGMELERLFFRINGEYIDTEAGLLRMGFGYGLVWHSMDFINPVNPLTINARPRGVIGANISFFPQDSLKLNFFAASPQEEANFISNETIHGIKFGFSSDKDWDKTSMQSLYVYETKSKNNQWGLHHFGFSLKTEIKAGLVTDMLYTLNPSDINGIKGLSAGFGADYSFLNGDLYLMAEYLYNGSKSQTAFDTEKKPDGRFNTHYLNITSVYRFNDYCVLSLAPLFCFDDKSLTAIAGIDYEVFQGFSVNLTAVLPLNLVNSAYYGEFGPYLHKLSLYITSKLRF